MRDHPVPKNKIVACYHRSIDLLSQAIRFTNCAYIFDNSTHEHIWLAEITDGHLTGQMPAWFKKALESKFNIKQA